MVHGSWLWGKGYGLRVKPLPAEDGGLWSERRCPLFLPFEATNRVASPSVKRGHLRVKGGVTNCQFFGINCQFFAKWGSFWCKRA